MLHVKAFVFNPVQENTYVLYNEKKECIIIDPGCYYQDESETLQSFIDGNFLSPKMLLNTHCHLDHIFGNKFIAETYGLVLHIHKKEEAMLQMAPASGLMFDLPFDNYQGNFIFLKEDDSFFLGDDKLKIIEAPGHSPGSICFYCAEQNFIISGDVLFENGIGRTDLPGGDHQTLLNSIEQKLFLLPNETTVYSGHGPQTAIGECKQWIKVYFS
jgi:glyoxylase-like metal-dependent hydrolase (beta-lactamase superfamily II)